MKKMMKTKKGEKKKKKRKKRYEGNETQWCGLEAAGKEDL